MGIENDALRRSATARSRTSLPLMGIENHRAITRSCCDRQGLITPHGDRKLGRCPRLLSAITSFSLPLMGIENTNVRRFSPADVHSISLPLMGIENTRAKRSMRSSATSSLPLMGIENRWRASSAKALCSSHYPSWGSKTVMFTHPTGPVGVPSLPLMGIENGQESRPGAQQHPLITPHGDRKPHIPSTFRPAQRRLITPHGDRKPLADLLPVVRLEHLITPHGDRNLGAAFGVSRTMVGHSLPLMGIENDGTLWLRYAGNELITPHGDRKPAGPGGDQLRGRLITPHGDRKHP